MRQSIFSILLVLLFLQGNTQQVQVVSADLERLKYKNGTMILYYGSNRLVQYVSMWTVKYKKEDNDQRIANALKERVATVEPYMYFEFKEGFDCSNANGYLVKKGINKNSIFGCTFIDFSENPAGAVLLPGNGTAAWNDPSRVTTEKVDQLETYAWALVNRIMEKRQKELEQEGWQRVYTEYNLAGGPKDERWIGSRVSASPDSMYRAIGTVMRSSYKLKLINADKLDANGDPVFIYENSFAGDVLGETTVFNPREKLSRLIFAAVSNDRVNTNNAGMIVYRKKYNMQDEFQSVLDDAKNNFEHFKWSETKDPNGVTVFNATPVFKLKKQMIYQDGPESKWYYSQFCNADDPYAPTIIQSVKGIIDNYVKTGKYRTESGEHEGDMVYRLMDTNGKILFQMGVGGKKISLNFFATSTGKSVVSNTGNPMTPVKEEPQKTTDETRTTVSETSSDLILPPNMEFVFQNWNWANITFKWSWLETPSYDKNVAREFLDLTGKAGGNKENAILRITQKTEGYTWAMGTPNVGKFNAYAYSGIFGLLRAEGSEFGQGLMILFKDGKKGEFSRLYFLIDPVRQTYWFGSQNPNKNQWVTHNHYTGNTYNIFSKAINKHVDDGKTITRNSLAIVKEANKFKLYINNQLVDTIDIDKNNDMLNNFEGIGIVTVDRQVSTVDKLVFAR